MALEALIAFVAGAFIGSLITVIAHRVPRELTVPVPWTTVVPLRETVQLKHLVEAVE